MFGKVFNFLKNACSTICILELLMDAVLLSGIYYLVFYNFSVKYSINADIFKELIILFSIIVMSGVFLNKDTNDKKFNDALKSIVLLAVLLIVGFMFYKDNTLMFYVHFTSIVILYFFCFKPIIRFIFMRKYKL